MKDGTNITDIESVGILLFIDLAAIIITVFLWKFYSVWFNFQLMLDVLFVLLSTAYIRHIKHKQDAKKIRVWLRKKCHPVVWKEEYRPKERPEYKAYYSICPDSKPYRVVVYVTKVYTYVDNEKVVKKIIHKPYTTFSFRKAQKVFRTFF